MTQERLDGPHAEAFLSACAALARESATSSTWLELSLKSLEAAYGERPLLPAPVLVFDLTALLNGERLQPVTPPAVEAVREALRGYEDHVLARLLGDRRWPRVFEAFTGLPQSLRAPAIGLVVTQVLQRLGVDGGTGVSIGVVRRLVTKSAEELIEPGRQALYEPEMAARVVEGLTMLARAARRTKELLSDAEVFLVENLAALKTLAARVALSQLAQVAQLVEERLPPRIRVQSFEDGDAPTQLEEDSVFPVGGFSAISTSGSLENLVTSELVYMDREVRPDLFDVRFVEGELLYYSRDESVAVRRRRALVIVFDASLRSAAVKDAGESYQRLVWVLGTMAALVRRLSEWLDTEALRFELVVAGAIEDSALIEEEAVLGLLLREYRERGQVDVRRVESSAQAVAKARQTHGQSARVFVASAQFPRGLEGEAAPEAIIDAGGPLPRVHWLKPGPAREVVQANAADAWSAVALELLDGVLKRR